MLLLLSCLDPLYLDSKTHLVDTQRPPAPPAAADAVDNISYFSQEAITKSNKSQYQKILVLGRWPVT